MEINNQTEINSADLVCQQAPIENVGAATAEASNPGVDNSVVAFGDAEATETPRVIVMRISWQSIIMKYEQIYRNHFPTG